MKTFNRTQTATIVFVTVMIILITAGSFILSFRNVNNTVTEYYSDISFIFPLILDISIVVFLIARMVGTLIDDKKTKNISLVLVFLATGLSLLFNQFDTIELALTQGLETREDIFTFIKGVFSHLVPPLFLLLAVEVVVIMIQGILKYRGIVIDIEEMKKEAKRKTQEAEAEFKQKMQNWLNEETSLLRELQQKRELVAKEDLRLERIHKEESKIAWNKKIGLLDKDEKLVLRDINLVQREISEKHGINLHKVHAIVAKLKNEEYVVENGSDTFVLNKEGFKYEIK